MASFDEPNVDEVFSKIVQRKGKVSFGNLREIFSAFTDVQIIQWFRAHPEKFVLFERDDHRIAMVGVRMRDANMCPKAFELQRSGDKLASCKDDKCLLLHVCHRFIHGNCDNGIDCEYDHHFQSGQSRLVLKRLGLEKFDAENLRLIVAQSQLAVCPFYNDQAGHCNFNDGCTRLHVCQRFVSGNCTGGCNMSHSLDETEHSKRLIKLFTLQGRPVKDVLPSLIIERKKTQAGVKNHERNRLPEFSRQLPNDLLSGKDVHADEVMSEVSSKSAVVENLVLVTKSSDESKAAVDKTMWQINVFDVWTSFIDSSSCCIEDRYCDPSRETLEASVLLSQLGSDDICTLLIHFNCTSDMKAELTTPGSNDVVSVNVKRVAKVGEWLWYWQEDDSSWMPFSELDQVQLETGFTSGQRRVYVCTERYRVKFCDWNQKNRSTGKIRAVRRRPIQA